MHRNKTLDNTNTMKIYDGQGKELLDITPNDNSYRYRAIMGDHTLTLYYEMAEHTELPVGAYCEFQGARYTLMRPENLTMRHTRYFEYTVTFHAPQAKAKIWKVRNTADGRMKFPLTAKPKDHLKLIVDNLNRRESGWTVGDCIDQTEQTVTYDHVYCLDALSSLASQFKTEYEFGGADGKCVSLRKVEYNKDSPLPLSYGRGNGFKSGVGRSNTKDNPPVEILYIQGGTRNIDPSKYGNTELLLPKSQTIRYDGAHFEGEDGFNAANTRTYVTDADGLSIRRGDKALTSMADDSLDCTEIYPSRVGEVTSVVVVDADKNFYDIIDNTIPDNLNFEDCLIDGETMTIIFQSGMLVSNEFEVKYYHNSENGKAARRFEIVPQEIEGETRPNASFIPKVGEKYAVFHCLLPQAYISDNATKSGASWDMFRQGVKYLYDNEGEQFTFKGELDGIWAKKDWTNIGGRIIVGGYIFFSDKQFQPEGALVRITGVKEYINNLHCPIIELSNTTVTAGVASTLKDLQGQEVLIEQSEKNAIQFTKRRFRDAKETMSMLEDALLDNFTNSITPIAVQTMSMLVGDESLQFRFVNSKTNPVQVAHQITWNDSTKTLTAAAGILQHMTLGITTLSSDHAINEYKFWDMAQYTSARLDNAEAKYYLYAKVSKTSASGEFILSDKAIKMEQVAGFYHLLYGILNSEYDGERSFATLYGFTEILPGRVTTDRVVSGDGNSFFDLVANALQLGDKLQFNIDGKKLLKVNGVIVQSLSGDENFIGCYRGVYNPSYTYYNADEVTYTENGLTSTYRYINATPAKGIAPTDTAHWQVVAKGEKGNPGDNGQSSFKSTVFIRQASQPTAPAGGSYTSPLPTTTGWSDGIPAGKELLWASTRIFTNDGKTPQQSAWTTPQQMTDTLDFDVEYSSLASPSDPTGHPNTNKQWSNEATTGTIWMAVSYMRNGTWTAWEVSKIKGEKGNPGDNGQNGPYWEYRYAWNGSTTAYPTISISSRVPGKDWSTTIPAIGSFKYLWMTVAKIDGENNTLLVNWSTPVRVTGEDGKDGKSPASPYRGVWNAEKEYYGNEYRVDIVKYGDAWYIARIDAGSFTGVVPTNTNKWNPFGASFESVATSLLLAEHAKIAGWIFRNGRLESQETSNGEPMAYLDGTNGTGRLRGILQLSTGWTGNYSDVNIFYLPAIIANKNITMGQDYNDIGKVVRLYNSSPFGGATYMISSNRFSAIKNGMSSGESYVSYPVRPQETIEMTCFERQAPSGNTKYGEWIMTGRMSVDNFILNGNDRGRFPRMLAMGKISGTSSSVRISGTLYDGRSISSIASVSRIEAGLYRVVFNGFTLPSGYTIFFTGVVGSDNIYTKGSVKKTSTTQFDVCVSDDASKNDGTVDFIILDPEWYYDSHA